MFAWSFASAACTNAFTSIPEPSPVLEFTEEAPDMLDAIVQPLYRLTSKRFEIFSWNFSLVLQFLCRARVCVKSDCHQARLSFFSSVRNGMAESEDSATQ